LTIGGAAAIKESIMKKRLLSVLIAAAIMIQTAPQPVSSSETSLTGSGGRQVNIRRLVEPSIQMSATFAAFGTGGTATSMSHGLIDFTGSPPPPALVPPTPPTPLPTHCPAGRRFEEIFPIGHGFAVGTTYATFGLIDTNWHVFKDGEPVTTISAARIDETTEIDFISVRATPRPGSLSEYSRVAFIIPSTGVITEFFDYGARGSGFVSVRRGDSSGIIDINGEFVVPLTTDYSFIGGVREGLASVRMTQGGLMGFINTSGQVVIAPVYANVRDFSGGYAAVFRNSRWGFIDASGQLVVPIEYDEVRNFVGGFAAVRRGDLWGFVDTSGRLVVPIEYNAVRNFAGGFAAARIGTERMGQWRFVDGSGNVIGVAGANLFSEVRDFSGGFAEVVRAQGRNERGEFIAPMWGVIDAAGNHVIPLRHVSVRRGNALRFGLAEVIPYNDDGSWRIITNRSDFLFDEYDAAFIAGVRDDVLYIWVRSEGLWGIYTASFCGCVGNCVCASLPPVARSGEWRHCDECDVYKYIRTTRFVSGGTITERRAASKRDSDGQYLDRECHGIVKRRLSWGSL
jgi:hypothetical protein